MTTPFVENFGYAYETGFYFHKFEYALVYWNGLYVNDQCTPETP